VISAQEVTAKPGETFDLDVSMANFPAPGVGALTLDISYDPAVLSPTNCQPDPDEQFNSEVCNKDFATGVIRISLLSTNGVPGDHRLATLEFTATGHDGDTSAITVTLHTISNPDGDAIQAATKHGKVTLEETITKGDVNCDNQVNTVDAMFIMQFEVGLRSGSDQCPPPADAIYTPACDVNADGQCNSVDALFIMQCEVGIPNAFCPASNTIQGAAALGLEQSSATIRADKGIVLQNGRTTIPIIAEMQGAALGAGTIELHFDPDIVRPTACQVDPHDKFDMKVCNINYASDAIRFTLMDTAGVNGKLTLANIIFDAVGEPGKSTDLSVATPTFADPKGDAITTTSENGRIDIWARLLRIFLPISH
jgi:hypothetical protein